MTKRRIHLTESQLHRLVEQSINEISTETKMSAANKAAQQAARYEKQAYTKGIPKLDREYAKDMATKRQRQRNTFVKGVNSDINNEKGAECADFLPNRYDATHNRGALFIKEPVYYGHSVTDPMYSSNRKRWEDYLRGNSYYERGRGWMGPIDNGYDIAKSEPWSEIRSGHNESVSRRMNEDINGDEDWEYVLDYIESDGRLRETIDWVIQACVKKARRGVVLDREHLANCYTLRRLCQIGVKMAPAYFEQRLYLSNEDKRKVREELADFILSFVNNEIEAQNESIAHRVTENIMRKLRRI